MTTTQRLPGWWYPYIYVAMFLVVITVNGIMAYFAITTFSGLDTEHAYERGLAYNRTIAQDETQSRLGWKVNLTVTGRPSDIVVSLRDRDGRPLVDAKVVIDIRRPTDAHHDQSVTLAPRGPGIYGAVVALQFPGQWDLRVQAELGGAVFRLRERVVVN